MKTKNETKKIAKLIFQSAIVSGAVNETKLLKIVKIIKSKPSSQGKAILKHLEKILSVYEKQNQLGIESAFKLGSVEEAKIKHKFEKILNRELVVDSSENKDLIGGIKVSNGDWVWEDSIISKLNQLKGNFINE